MTRSGGETCPRCGLPRTGAFRYCRGCGFDFDSLPPLEPVTIVNEPDPTTAGSVPPPQRSRRRAYAVAGVVGVLVLAAVALPRSPDSGEPSAPAAIASTTPGPATSQPTKTLALTPSASPTFGPTGRAETGTVSRVTDGDTIRVIVDGEDVPVRYIGIDTPEPDDPDPAVKAMADRATAANAALVEGRSVILERDVSETDQFDRWLRDVWVEGEDGELLHVGLELVRGGFAQVSTFPPDVKYADLLVETQAAARVAQVGLWAPVPTPTPEPTPIRFADSDLVFVDSEERTRFEGGVGDYTWSNLVVEGDRMTVRWDVTAGAAACRLAWEVQAVDGTGFNSTVRVDAGDREEDNRRYDVDFTEVAFVASSTCESWVMTMQTRAPAPDADCDDSYVGVCIPPYPPDLDCGEIPFRDFEVVGSDPHGFDREGDGLGCES